MHIEMGRRFGTVRSISKEADDWYHKTGLEVRFEFNGVRVFVRSPVDFDVDLDRIMDMVRSEEEIKQVFI